MTSPSLPTIDLSHSDEQSAARLLLHAAATSGFVYVRSVGLDISAAHVENAFALDRGWSGPYAESLDKDVQPQGDFKEALNFGEFKQGRAQQPLPTALKDKEADIDLFARLCRSLCQRILRLFAVALSIPEEEGGRDWFASRHDPSKGPSGSILRLLYYPATAEATDGFTSASSSTTEQIRCGAHTDFGGMTLLFQRPAQPGLEIQTSEPTPSWMPVAVSPPGTESDPFPPIVLNIGDMLSEWTDGLLKSTMHRVVIPAQRREERYSIAYFCHPVATTELVPVPSPVIAARGSGKLRGKGAGVLTAAQHLQKRLADTYGWKDEQGPKHEAEV